MKNNIETKKLMIFNEKQSVWSLTLHLAFTMVFDSDKMQNSPCMFTPISRFNH